MKKNLSLVLALLMVLAMAVPTFAFTADEYADDDSGSPFELDIVLLDYDEGYVSKHVLGLPEASRGYLRNEVICAMASIYMPKKEAINDKHEYTSLIFGGDNVTLDVQDNDLRVDNRTWGNNRNNQAQFELFTNLPGATATRSGMRYPGALDAMIDRGANEVDINLNDSDIADIFENANASRDFTANIAIFGKVVQDDGIVYVELTKNSDWHAFGEGPIGEGPYPYEKASPDVPIALGSHYIIVGDYIVVVDDLDDPREYFIFSMDNDDLFDTLLFSVTVDSRDRTTGAYFYDLETTGNSLCFDDYNRHEVTVTYNDGVIFATGTITSDNDYFLEGSDSGTDGALYDRLYDIYDDDFVDGWGFSYTSRGNVLKDSFFQDGNKADNLYAEVEVMPFQDTIEIVVPPIVIEDPPKVG